MRFIYISTICIIFFFRCSLLNVLFFLTLLRFCFNNGFNNGRNFYIFLWTLADLNTIFQKAKSLESVWYGNIFSCLCQSRLFTNTNDCLIIIKIINNWDLRVIWSWVCHLFFIRRKFYTIWLWLWSLALEEVQDWLISIFIKKVKAF